MSKELKERFRAFKRRDLFDVRLVAQEREKGMPRSRQSRGLSVPVPERAGRRHVILPDSYASARPFTLDDARFMEAVAHVIAGALDREASEQ